MSLIAHDATHRGLHLGFEVSTIHYLAKTAYQEVLIAETPAFGKALFMDRILQSAAFDEGRYHSALVHPGMFAHRAPRRVLIGGGGEGATLREVLRHPGVEAVRMVDIDAEAVVACRAHLPEWHRGAFDDPRVELVHDDIRHCLEGEAGRWDVVILDLGDPVASQSSMLAATREFYALVRGALREGGVLALQAGEADGAASTNFATFLETLRRAFGHVVPYRLAIPSFCSLWGFAMAAAHDLPPVPPDLDARFDAAGGDEWLDYDPEGHRAMVWLSRRDRARLAEAARVFTDHAPITLAE